MFDVCVVGHVARDVNTIGGSEQRPKPGGTAYYASMAYRSLGLRTAVVTCVAEEDQEELLRELRTSGAEIFNLPTSATTVFQNHYAPENPDIRMQRVSSVARPIFRDDLPSLTARTCHLGPLTRRDIEPDVIRHCATTGALVALDVQGLIRSVVDGRVVADVASEKAWAALGCVHVLKADDDEILTLTGEPTLSAAVQAVARAGVREVIITKASRGSVVAGPGRSVSLDAIPPRTTIDTTGCGDTYLAGYVVRRITSDCLEECAEYGAVAASMNVESLGPFNGTLEDIQERWRSFRGTAQVRLHPPEDTGDSGPEADAPSDE